MIQAPSMLKSDFLSIKIKHLPTTFEVMFDGWVTAFSDNFNSNWSSTTVYGRMDPLVTFQNTQRNISLSFDVVSANTIEAMNNLVNVNTLIQFLYPVYEIGDAGTLRSNQNTLKAAPLIGLAWTNLVSNAHSGEYLVGYLGGVNYAPDVAEGGFYIGEKQSEIIGQAGTGQANPTFHSAGQGSSGGSLVTQGDTSISVDRPVMRQMDQETATQLYIPKKLNISLQFGVLHTHLPGWYEGDEGFTFGTSQLFPNANNIRSTTTTTADFNILEDDETGLPVVGSDGNFQSTGAPLSSETSTMTTPEGITESEVANILDFGR